MGKAEQTNGLHVTVADELISDAGVNDAPPLVGDPTSDMGQVDDSSGQEALAYICGIGFQCSPGPHVQELIAIRDETSLQL